MLYTVTLNPSIDQILQTNGFVLGETNYYDDDYQVVGGKGINVGVLLNNLGVDVVVTGLMGLDNNQVFLEQFKQINLKHDFVFYPGKSRTNFKIKDFQNHQETELNGQGSRVEQNLVQDLLTYLDTHLQPHDVVIASGSVPTSVSENIYEQIGMIVNHHEAIFILDSSKQWVKYGLKAHPYLIKPNVEEICQMLNQEYNPNLTLTQLEAMIKELQVLGARNILVSRGSKGSYYFSEHGEVYQVNTAKGKLVNSVGAGDSMVGGFAYGMSKNLALEEILKFGAASGAATAFSSWIGSKDLVMELKEQIKVEQLTITKKGN
ncbi:Tagatose-6-phosphate kinase [Mesoplasma sp. JKS002658]|uniref:1-phosphofructokinase n=1 Tax=Mesoplasma whartonense TaxID=2878854 RepID=UPI002022B055|nr:MULTISPECIES: 1-phosphofructokinase [unclassified Mesoplasma]MCL8211354.1 Tagatose-6-phosphate kinase [Mesoplasma sp. JKS002664]MCL8212207.1 Tagatose-6-phosphate kinase [Mesoplasma sp. JKS002662]MCL8212529.1 Tagatose-6-phosphate kinase [Mesoplasma sp. JKS002661]MCL8214264.1 Tagatose-6-phosphate kinase [Mesoplasma sp. JKS002658]MCL8214692.1 Tagatose-6-phosphate kinase [Mesoplasma sp. JKS002663]